MPNQRDPDQQLVGFWADQKLRDKIDRARGSQARSQFLRDAVRAHLAEHGIYVEAAEAAAPDRAGKGGRKKKFQYPPVTIEGHVLNEK